MPGAMSEVFRHEIAVGDGDIDFLGHASNLSFVRWIQDTAVAHSSAVGLDVAKYRQLGSVFIIIRHEIDYVRPAMGGDTIDARTWVPTVTTAKCFRHTEFLRKADGQMLAKGITTWAFMDIATGRPKRILPEVRAAFGWDPAAPAQ
jgi:acyl-CoA thioester hydrolase